MPSIHLLTRKEEIDKNKISNVNVVVVDTLLATTTISMLFEHGAENIYPVSTREEAMDIKAHHPGALLIGEYLGYEIDGFLKPDPVELIKAGVSGKTIIFLSTNGTKALNLAKTSPFVVSVSPFTIKSTVDLFQRNENNRSILIVCAGNHGRFSIGDFLTAGALLSALSHLKTTSSWKLSDSASAAKALYEQTPAKSLDDLMKHSETAQFLLIKGYEAIISLLQQQIVYSHSAVLDINGVLQKRM